MRVALGEWTKRRVGTFDIHGTERDVMPAAYKVSEHVLFAMFNECECARMALVLSAAGLRWRRWLCILLEVLSYQF